MFAVGLTAIGVSVLFFAYKNLPEIPNLKNCYQVSVSQKKLCPGSDDYTAISSLQEHTIWAFVLSEDAAFFGHKGVDWFEVKEAFKKNIKTKKFARGGSTISQQTVKNLLLSNEKSLVRKVKELALTTRLEEQYSKQKILETYLNIIEFGLDLYGIKAASQFYFSKSPQELSLAESLFLSTLLPSPKKYGRAIEDEELHERHQDLIVSVAKRFSRFKKAPKDEVEYLIDNISYDFFFNRAQLNTDNLSDIDENCDPGLGPCDIQEKSFDDEAISETEAVLEDRPAFGSANSSEPTDRAEPTDVNDQSLKEL